MLKSNLVRLLKAALVPIYLHCREFFRKDWMRSRMAPTGWQTVWLGLALVGCSSGTKDATIPKFDPAAATAAAQAEFDANGDGKFSEEELKKSPGLTAARGVFDSDNDGSLSVDELKAGLQQFHLEGASLVTLSCHVTHNGEPLEGATVALVPEPFMGEALKPATGVTTRSGGAALSVADEEIPAAVRGKVQGAHCGIFRVVVTHPTVKVPAKYNEQTELGRVVSRRNNEPVTVSF